MQRKEFKLILQVGGIICSLVHLRRVVPLRRAVHSSHQFFGEVTNQVTNFKSPIFLFQVTKMCYIIQLNHTAHFDNLKQKSGDLKLVIWLVTSPKNCWLEWTARLRLKESIRNLCVILVKILFTSKIIKLYQKWLRSNHSTNHSTRPIMCNTILKKKYQNTETNRVQIT